MLEKKPGEDKQQGLLLRFKAALTRLSLAVRAYVGWIIDRLSQWLLFSSSCLSAWIYRICLKPDSFASFLFALGASENPQLTAAFQIVVGGVVLLLNRGLSSASFLTKVLFGFNAITAALQLSMLKPAFQSRDAYLNAFKANKLDFGYFNNKTAVYLAMFLSLISPRSYLIQGNGFLTKSNPLNKNLVTESYADMKKVDPELLKRVDKMPTGVRNIYASLARGNIRGWLDCDILRNDEVLASVERNPKKLFPVLLVIHGGGWVTVDKSINLRPTMEYLATNFNVIVVKANYRLAPECIFPDQFVDVKRAIIWVKNNIEKFGGNPKKICLTGESAGGHLVALASVTQNLPMFQPPEITDLQKADTSVDLLVDIYGVFDFLGGDNKFIRSPSKYKSGIVILGENVLVRDKSTSNRKAFEAVSPIHQLQRLIEHYRHEKSPDLKHDIKIPPTLIIHGNKDALASYEDSEQFYEKLLEYRKVSGDVVYKHEDVEKPIKDVFVEIDGGHHGFGYMKSPRSVSLAIAIASYMNSYFEDVTQPRNANKL